MINDINMIWCEMWILEMLEIEVFESFASYSSTKLKNN